VWLKAKIDEYLAVHGEIDIVPMGPLLASLAWLGAVGIAVLPEV
jgi:fatty acid-binding protein DegV